MLVSSYIHMNPVKDSLVNRPEEYKWSSYNDFVSERNNILVCKDFLTEIFGSIKNFMKENKRLYERVVSKTVFDI